MDKAIYKNLSGLLVYPDDDFVAGVNACEQSLLPGHSQAAASVKAFHQSVAELSMTRREELYVATFDVQAVCCLDLGFVLFGEDYKRGRMLAYMKALSLQVGHDSGTELPDHLPVVLGLLTCMTFEDGRSLVSQLVLPAMAKMISGFTGENPYRHALEAIESVLRQDFDCQSLVIDLKPFEHKDETLAEELGEA